MSYLKITNYLRVLLKEGRKWEFSDLLDQNSPATDKQIRNYSWIKRSILLTPTILVCLFLKKGIDKDAVGYAIAALSIFIGLFSSLIITIYGRFLAIPKLGENATQPQEIEDKKIKNFIRQFTFITGKNLLVSTILIALMLLILVFPDYMSLDAYSLKFVDSTQLIDFQSSLLALNAVIAIALRIFIIYLGFAFFLSLLYSLGALFAFLKREYK